jgi:hypothetical protein
MDQYNNYNNYPQQPQPYRAPVGPQPNLLVFGILSRAISAVVGIILGSIGRSKGNAYIAQGGTLTGASKVGYILCKVGFILSIISTVCTVLIIILAICGVFESSSYHYYYY